MMFFRKAKMDVTGRVVLTAGASSGRGAALAEKLAAMGAQVMVNYSRSAEAANAVVARISEAGGRALAVKGCFGRIRVQKLVRATIEHFGRLDALVSQRGHDNLRPPRST